MVEIETRDANGETESVVENHCETLRMSLVTTFNEGLRNGGGIGDFLMPLSQNDDQVSVKNIESYTFVPYT